MVALPDLPRAAARVLHASRSELWFAVRAWTLAPVVESALAAVGVRRTLVAVRVLHRPSWLTRSPRALAVEDGAAWVDRAYAVHVLRGACLPRAIVQHALHRLDGTPSRLIVGVRSPPGVATRPARPCIEAHAWVAAHAQGGEMDASFAQILEVDDRAPS